MKRKGILIALAVACTLSMAGCQGGPNALAKRIEEATPGANARSSAAGEKKADTSDKENADKDIADKDIADKDAANDNEDKNAGDSLISKDFGTYELPEGWEENAAHSGGDKFFYVEEGHGDDAQPDNISINVGSSNYAEDDYMTFKDAILSQLMMQVQGSDARVNGEGTYTDSGDVLLVYTITETGCTTKQYYIVGDYEYCLILLTVYSGDDTGEIKAAETMVNSFQWAD